ncbi:unnamed protein product [Amoebophrya sp. A120]|nr:unnamed protein product [Amoebophrya sp. A120]|eukprot:GSA120T00012519001.1
MFVLGSLFTQLYDRFLKKDRATVDDDGDYIVIEYAILFNLLTQIPIVFLGLYIAVFEFGKDIVAGVRKLGADLRGLCVTGKGVVNAGEGISSAAGGGTGSGAVGGHDHGSSSSTAIAPSPKH